MPQWLTPRLRIGAAVAIAALALAAMASAGGLNVITQTTESAVNVIWKGATLMTPIGGGVQIHPTKAIQTNYLLPDEKGAVAKVREGIELEKLGPTQWWWD